MKKQAGKKRKSSYAALFVFIGVIALLITTGIIHASVKKALPDYTHNIKITGITSDTIEFSGKINNNTKENLLNVSVYITVSRDNNGTQQSETFKYEYSSFSKNSYKEMSSRKTIKFAATKIDSVSMYFEGSKRIEVHFDDTSFLIFYIAYAALSVAFFISGIALLIFHYNQTANLTSTVIKSVEAINSAIGKNAANSAVSNNQTNNISAKKAPDNPKDDLICDFCGAVRGIGNDSKYCTYCGRKFQ